MEGQHPPVYTVPAVAFGVAIKGTFCIFSDIAWSYKRAL